MSTTPGRFITFEGIDSSGKGVQSSLLNEWLLEKCIPHIVTAEPGGTELGKNIRDILLAPNSDIDDPIIELMMFAAARRKHLNMVILPALTNGEWVVCDRYNDSTYAYQGGGEEIGMKTVKEVLKAASIQTEPDLTFLLDIPPKISLERCRKRRNEKHFPTAPGKGKALYGQQGTLWEDRFESQQQAYFERVCRAYRKIAKENPSRIIVIDGTKSAKEVHATVRRMISLRFGLE